MCGILPRCFTFITLYSSTQCVCITGIISLVLLLRELKWKAVKWLIMSVQHMNWIYLFLVPSSFPLYVIFFIKFRILRLSRQYSVVGSSTDYWRKAKIKYSFFLLSNFKMFKTLLRLGEGAKKETHILPVGFR